MSALIIEPGITWCFLMISSIAIETCDNERKKNEILIDKICCSQVTNLICNFFDGQFGVNVNRFTNNGFQFDWKTPVNGHQRNFVFVIYLTEKVSTKLNSTKCFTNVFRENGDYWHIGLECYLSKTYSTSPDEVIVVSAELCFIW